MKLPGYAESFGRLEASLPTPERPVRRAALDRFMAAGFPDKSSESWHYTDLSALNDRRFELPSSNAARQPHPAIDDAERLVFVDGEVDRSQSSPAGLALVSAISPAAADTQPLLDLNTAFATAGLDLRIAAGQRMPKPLHVLLIGTGSSTPSMCHQRHVIQLAAQAEAEVFFELVGDDDAERLATQRLDITLAAGSRLKLVRIQRERAGSTLIGNTAVRLDRDATLEAVLVDAGTGLSRHQFDVTLAAPGAQAGLHALSMPTAKAHDDTQVRLVHAAPHGRSRLGFRGLVDDRATAIFNGRVVVQAGAQKTDSEQRIASLLLSPRAQINAKPDLEIHADDVKCAHGATVGQLDAAALGYLRSRGLDTESARRLLLRAFAIEALEPIDHAPLRRHLETLLGFPPEEVLQAEVA